MKILVSVSKKKKKRKIRIPSYNSMDVSHQGSSLVSSFLLVKCRLILDLPIRAYRALLDRSLEVNIDRGSMDKLGQMGIGVHHQGVRWCVFFSPSEMEIKIRLAC